MDLKKQFGFFNKSSNVTIFKGTHQKKEKEKIMLDEFAPTMYKNSVFCETRSIFISPPE